MTISDDCGLQDDQRDGSSNVEHSTVMDSEGVKIKEEEWEDDVLCSLLSRHSNDVGHDMFRGSCVVERVQEVEDDECKFDSNRCEQIISKRYVCDVCDKAFNWWCDLNRHKRTHTGEKPYICDVCKKTFSRRDHLNSHKRIHTGESPYTCDICNKAYSRLYHLKLHKRIHTGQSPYTCDICNKAFRRQDNLNRHKCIHTGEKRYICEMCNKEFSQLLNVHTRTPTCEICAYKLVMTLTTQNQLA